MPELQVQVTPEHWWCRLPVVLAPTSVSAEPAALSGIAVLGSAAICRTHLRAAWSRPPSGVKAPRAASGSLPGRYVQTALPLAAEASVPPRSHRGPVQLNVWRRPCQRGGLLLEHRPGRRQPCAARPCGLASMRAVRRRALAVHAKMERGRRLTHRSPSA